MLKKNALKNALYFSIIAINHSKQSLSCIFIL